MSAELIGTTETEVVNVDIPYTEIPSPPNTIEIEAEDIVRDNENIETAVNLTSSRKNSWVWSFYSQVQTPNGVFTICNVEMDDGTKCDKRYKTKGSTGNLINHLLNHGITKDNQQPLKVYKIIIISYFYCILILNKYD